MRLVAPCQTTRKPHTLARSTEESRIKPLARETTKACSTILDLVPLHQVRAQALLCVRPHLVQYATGVAMVKVVRG